MKKLFYLLLILGLSISIVSCEKDDNKDSSYSSMIVGTWQGDKMWENGHITTDWDEDDEEVPYILFSKNGTGKFQEYDSYDDETYEESFMWTISEDRLTIKYLEEYEGEDNYEISGIIKSLTNKELVLEYNDPSIGEHWREYYIKVK